MPLRGGKRLKFAKRNVDYYAREIARERNLPLKQVQAILRHGWKKTLRAIERGEEIRIKGFGTFYTQKQRYHDRDREG